MDVNADERNRKRLGDAANLDFSYLDLRLLADVVGGIEVLSPHFPQRAILNAER